MASRLTELEAINGVLRMLGRQPVNSLAPADLVPDAAFALEELRTVNRQVQLQGWYFNQEWSVQLLKNVDNRVPLTDDIGRVEIPHRGTRGWHFWYYGASIIARQHPTDGYCLYDKSAAERDEDPFDFSHFADVRVDLVRLLDFEDTPDSFRHYIQIRTGRNVQGKLLGDPATYRFTAEDEARALQVLAREELATSDANALNTDVARRITWRRR